MNDAVRRQIKVCSNHWFAINVIYLDYAKKYGLTVYQLYILWLLWESDDTFNQQQIQSYLALPKTTLNSILANFRDRGWIEFVVDSKDRRSKEIRLTPEGDRFCEPLLTEMHEIESRAYSRMTKEQLNSLSALCLLEAEYLRDAFEEDAAKGNPT